MNTQMGQIDTAGQPHPLWSGLVGTQAQSSGGSWTETETRRTRTSSAPLLPWDVQHLAQTLAGVPNGLHCTPLLRLAAASLPSQG